LAEKELEMRTGKRPSGNSDVDSEKEFRNIGEYLYAIARFKADGVRDSRLDLLYEKHEEQRAMSMGTGSEGGYALPDQFDANLRQVQAQEGIIRSRATIIPAGSPPDAKLSFPALDQTSGSNNYGGVTITHTGEAITMTETSAALREVSLEPKEMSAYIVVTNKLLNNWEAAGTIINRILTSAVNGQEDYDFMRGDGINKALGFINSSAAISHSRTAGNAIAFTDVCGMLPKMLMRGAAGQFVWLASQTTIPQLTAMVDAGSHAVWVGGVAPGLQGAAGPLPSTLLGIPVVFADRLPALGTKGDFNLVNCSYYTIKDGSGPYAASSEHIYFLSNRTVFKIVWNVDAKPWLTEPLRLEGDSSQAVSPFVILN
jgi:HK97 family phage major capsid protein